jgi:hypothetical protein
MHGHVKYPERWRETYGQYGRSHRPRVYSKNRRYRERHRDEIRARNKAAREKDPELTRQRKAVEYQRILPPVTQTDAAQPDRCDDTKSAPWQEP